MDSPPRLLKSPFIPDARARSIRYAVHVKRIPLAKDLHLMKDLLRERIPHAPQMGLFVRPDVPVLRLQNALMDYGPKMEHEEVLALYDATLSGNGKDGAVFAEDRFIFQNTDLQAPQTVRYTDLVGVEVHTKWFGLGGKRIDLTVNRGRATFTLSMDFSGQPKAAEYVANFLETAMIKDVSFQSYDESLEDEQPPTSHAPASNPKTPHAPTSNPETAQTEATPAPEASSKTEEKTDEEAVRAALESLHTEGALAQSDLDRLLDTLSRTDAGQTGEGQTGEG